MIENNHPENESGAVNLTAKQQRFVDEYLIDLNATAAYKRAGYKATGHSAESAAARLLSNVEVAKAIAQAQEKRQERTFITADRVLQELARIAFFDIRKLYNADGSLKGMHELDDDAAAVLAGVDVVEMQGGMEVGGKDGAKHVPMYTKKAKTHDKVGSLSLAMRHLGILVDKVEATGKGGKDLIPATTGVMMVPMPMSEEAWEAAAKGDGSTG